MFLLHLVLKYYRYVASPTLLVSRCALALVAVCLLLTAACNRGARPTQLGRKAPEFSLPDGAKTIRLADYRGKIVLVNFWASWCGPCIEETPALIELHHERPDIAILGISIDEDPGAYRRFIQRFHVDYTTVLDPDEKVARLYGTDGWPETYILDRKGIIRRKVVGDPDWSNPEIRAFLQGL
jgi:cytochrome c biogenesis protein CcmG/thiol:disulfide interchange protein DsbE